MAVHPAQLDKFFYGSAFHHAAASPLTGLLINLELANQHEATVQSPYLSQALINARYLQQLFKLNQEISDNDFSAKTTLLNAVTLVRSQYPQVVINTHLMIDKLVLLTGSSLLFQEAVICTIRNSIESYPDHTKNCLVMLTAKKLGQKLQLSFVDGGCGMNFIQKSFMFADGFSTKKTGSGQGLSWVKRVVKNQFQGRITVQTKRHTGTTITWELPLVKPAK